MRNAKINHPKVSIITVNWNGLEDTTECLESLKKVIYLNYEVIVVDNGSDGNDAQIFKERFGDYIQLVQNDKNYGYGEGYNTGIRYVLANSKPKYILLINNDVVVDPIFLDELVRVAEIDKQISVAGLKIYHYDYKGRKDVIWSAGGKISRWALKIHHQIGETDNDLPKYQTLMNVDWISGAVLMFRSSLTEKVGLLNPWYFFGHEDIEFCLKARNQGFKIMYIPTAKAWHKIGASAKKANITYADPASYYYLIRQCFPLYVYIYHLLLSPALLSRWALLYLIRHRDRNTLRRFFSDFARFILQRRKQSL
ncbi:glycosyltransferase family 2 protein [Chloroflexota bacterium]